MKMEESEAYYKTGEQSELLGYFAYEQLPPKLQRVSRPFGELARQIADRRPFHHQTIAALNDLLRAKDAAVRAALGVEE